MSPIAKNYLQTGLSNCHDSQGRQIACAASGQDAEFKTGIPLIEKRYEKQGDLVLDHLTGLTWTLDANRTEYPMTWQEALDHVRQMNKESAFGFSDWRMPNRIELRSLVDHGVTRPVIAHDAPFLNIEQSWYWTSTTAVISPAHAWYVQMSGGRMFYGHKSQFFLLWPVRGKGKEVLRQSGQTLCFDINGKTMSCDGTGQDGQTCLGADWPNPRFVTGTATIKDKMTGLEWLKRANMTDTPVTWEEALEAIAQLNESDNRNWRLPNINELESLVDCSTHSPALPRQHGFSNLHDTYWSSTTSLYEPDWSFALYLDKGAVGVGHKRAANFYVWPVHG